MEVLLIAACSLLMLVGLAGVILPFLPGVPLAWLGLFIYAIGTGFEGVSVLAVVVFFVVAGLTVALDFIAPMIGARGSRASIWGMLGALAGFVLGIIFLGFWGAIAGPIAGAFLGELLAKRSSSHALRSAVGALVGSVLGSILKIVVILVMAGFFIRAVV